MPKKIDTKVEEQLISDMVGMSGDPLAWVYYSFEWGKGELDGQEPEQWQIEILKDIRDGLKTPNEAIREAVASGHGIGKSALVAWIILWALSTFPDTRGVVTANTDTQLRTKTWAELAVWYRRMICKHWFTLTATAIYSIDSEHEKTWRFDAIPWSKTNTEAFAGLHNKGKRIVLIFDEASAVDDKIWEVAEGALTDEGTEIIWCVFGNPTRNSGRFRECFHKYRHRWKTKQIDSRTVKISNKKLFEEWISDYGEDSDFVKVRVRGIFPSGTINQLIPRELAEKAAQRKYSNHDIFYAPVILGMDVAWEGDDSSAIYKRQGMVSWKKGKWHGADSQTLGGLANQFIIQDKADALFIDIGWGSGVVDYLRRVGQDPIPINFGGKAISPEYANKRTEMWCELKKWLEDGGAIPNEPHLIDDLCSPEIYFQPNGKKILESKKDMKTRGLASPDDGDALALTFAMPVSKKSATSEYGVDTTEQVKTEYDVLA